MVPTVRFLHMADLHIGLRVSRFDENVTTKIQEARFKALENATEAALEREVDFVVMAGDIFDDNAVSQVESCRVYEMLRRKPMPIYVLPGNHDPYCHGSVWQRHPWTNLDGASVKLLSRPEPIHFEDKAILYPCPVTRKSSSDNPTEWIGREDAAREAVRIGIAHGTVMDRDTLPPDDHPIPLDCADVLGLDYLALGHWHCPRKFEGKGGTVRMAYPGTHEQIGFGKDVPFPIGWQAYSSFPDRDEFFGEAHQLGKALVVEIAKGEAPRVEPVDVGHCRWVSETHEVVDDENFSRIFSEYARRENTERTLLHLTLRGTVSADSIIHVEGFKKMLGRYLYCQLDVDGLHIKPDDEKMEEAVGQGVLRELLAELRRKKREEKDAEKKLVLERAMAILYELTMVAGR